MATATRGISKPAGTKGRTKPRVAKKKGKTRAKGKPMGGSRPTP